MPFNIAIVGAGLAGPALALELLRFPEITTRIYELRPEGYEQGQHISLAPNALRVLRNLGVYEKLTAIGNSYEELHLRNSIGGYIATFHNGHKRDYGFAAMRIHRRHVQRVLCEEAIARGVQIIHGMKLVKVTERSRDKGVELLFGNGQTESADMVVGTDGLHSAVRQYVQPGADSIYAHMLGVTGFLSKKDLYNQGDGIELPSHFIGRNGFLAVMPSDLSGNEIGFFSTMEFPEEKSREEWNALFHDKNKIRTILTERFGMEQDWAQLIESIGKTAPDETLCTWPFYVAPPLSSWSSASNRALILGDAAHAMIPTGGLGASLALEDTECLALALSSIIGKGFTDKRLGRVLDAWEAHRKVRLKLIQDFTDRNRRMRQPGGSPIAQVIKEWVLWAALRFVPSGRIAGPIYSYDTTDFKNILSTLDL
ncbi:hypothetical protein H2204_006791 [Knufia peltigerae]|uniref:FAD-binding domain-containing protein n=1 Tax=Knufia peltigerae TaxID=1002370 RepID=A0AA38Y481_9EURO|nr:hypothetical protein H2204_006791 [Knufia peltigerae]